MEKYQVKMWLQNFKLSTSTNYKIYPLELPYFERGSLLVGFLRRMGFGFVEGWTVLCM